MRPLSEHFRIRTSWGELAETTLAAAVGGAFGMAAVVYLVRWMGL